ncbi:hypothetical protein A20C1_01391 [marine actinobacterium PHSC20C1]|nr:hypothetical protein A20C1_01391 [marine actinobacterium PHSC20C1]
MPHSSDDDYIAPVINMFGDRKGANRAETSAHAASSEESSVPPSVGNWADEPEDGDTIEVAAETLSVLKTPSPVRALPTMADFESKAYAATEPSTQSQQAQPKAERRQSRDGFSEISRVSMRALARRGMSSFEMTQFLGTREFDTDEIATEIERLEGSALLDDAALAETLARTLRDRKGLGASAIKAELRRRKIDNEHIEVVIGEERDEEQERATEIALKRAPQLRSLDSVTAKRRLTAFLMRRGYSGSIISVAVAAALAPGSPESSGGPVFR